MKFRTIELGSAGREALKWMSKQVPHKPVVDALKVNVKEMEFTKELDGMRLTFHVDSDEARKTLTGAHHLPLLAALQKGYAEQCDIHIATFDVAVLF